MKTMARRHCEILAAAATLILGIAALADEGFHFYGPLRRVITPNAQSNRRAIFCFNNPADSYASGAIYSMLGTRVVDFGPRQSSAGTGTNCPASVPGSASQFLSWDGTAEGKVVGAGVYVYQVWAEGRSYTGTVLVVR